MAVPAVPLPPPPVEEADLWEFLHRAEEIGLKLEITDTGITWETMPGFRHQELVGNIFGAINPATKEGKCECIRAMDVYIRFPSGVVKRPDISIFCRRPEQEEGFVKMVPEAVIEITSPDYEAKDLIAGPPLYLANGVKDVVVLHRAKNEVRHTDAVGTQTHASPITLTLACGCQVTV